LADIGGDIADMADVKIINNKTIGRYQYKYQYFKPRSKHLASD